MDKAVYDLLLQMQTSMNQMNDRLNGLENLVAGEMNEHQKLIGEAVNRVEGQVNNIEEQVNRIEGQVNSVEKQVNRIEGQVNNIEEQVNRVEGQVNNIEEQVNRVEGQVNNIEEQVNRVEGQVNSVEEAVNRIEETQRDDVLGFLRTNKKKIEFETDYLNNRLNEMDKRLFVLEKKL